MLHCVFYLFLESVRLCSLSSEAPFSRTAVKTCPSGDQSSPLLRLISTLPYLSLIGFLDIIAPALDIQGKTGASSYPVWPKNHFGADSNWEDTDSGEALCPPPALCSREDGKTLETTVPSPMWGHRENQERSSPDTGLWEPCSWTFCLQTGEKQTCAV